MRGRGRLETGLYVRSREDGGSGLGSALVGWFDALFRRLQNGPFGRLRTGSPRTGWAGGWCAEDGLVRDAAPIRQAQGRLHAKSGRG